MRISTLARAAGVSTRSVRFYHQLGILPEPRRESNGYRVYSFDHLARLLRLRWLADSGLPLAAAGPAATSDEHDLLDQVDQTLARLEERLTDLQRQQRLLNDLRSNLAAGRRLSPLPVALNETFESLLGRTQDDTTRQVVQTEREAMETLALSGGVSPRLLDQYAAIVADPGAATTALPLLRRFGDLHAKDPARWRDDIRSLAADITGHPSVVEFLRVGTGGDGTSNARSGSVGADGGPELHDMVPDPAQREVLAVMLKELRP